MLILLVKPTPVQKRINPILEFAQFWTDNPRVLSAVYKETRGNTVEFYRYTFSPRIGPNSYQKRNKDNSNSKGRGR